MKFSCTKSSILKDLSNSLEFTSQRNSLSILSNVLLKTHDDSLEIEATDQKVGFHADIAVKTIEAGSTTVFCDRFLDIIKNLPEGEIIFEVMEDVMRITQEGQRIDISLRVIPSESFPELENLDDSFFFKVPQRAFTEMIDQTINSISDEETKYYMSGVFFEKNDNKLIMVGTDGKRLSCIERCFDCELKDFNSVIIPPKFLNQIKKMGTGEGTFELGVSESTIFAKFDNKCIYSGLIKGDFPNYRKVIPTALPKQAIQKVSDVLDALKRVSVLVEGKAHRIILEVNDGKMIISSEGNDVGRAVELIDSEYSGEPCRFALNYSYLITPLKVMTTDKFSFNFSEPMRAVVIKPEPESDYLHVVMPMQA